MFPLIHGNPEHQPASSTRFVLPFAYQLSAGHGKPHFYEPLAPSSQPAPAAAEALLRRARWFQVKWALYNRLEGKLNLRDGRRLRAVFSPPRLALFEYPQDGAQAGPDILRTGFLILDMHFPDGKELPQLEDLLEINELFSLWRQDGAGGQDSRHARLLKNWPANVTGEAANSEDAHTRRWEELLNLPIRAGENQWLRVIPAESPTGGEWRVHNDERAYVWSCALIQGGGGALGKAFPQPKDKPLSGCNFGHWIKLLNVDKPGSTPEETHACRRFERECAAQSNYPRWEDAGIFHGFSSRSGAMLGAVLAKDEPPLWKAFGQAQFDQALLLLYVRTSLLRFSQRLAGLSAAARDTASQDGFREEFAKLRWDFALFSNLYLFPPAANRQQSAEMCRLVRKAMEIDALFDGLRTQIQGSQDCLALSHGQRQADMDTLLAVIAAAGLSAGLAALILGMGVFIDEWKVALGEGPLTGAVLAGSVLFVLLAAALGKPLANALRRLAGLGGG